MGRELEHAPNLRQVDPVWINLRHRKVGRRDVAMHPGVVKFGLADSDIGASVRYSWMRRRSC